MTKAKPITEALTGPELAVLKKYKIANEDGQLRMVELVDSKDPDRYLPPAPIVATEVITRLLALDLTPDKHILDWIFYVAGGGQRAFDASQMAVDQAKEWMFDNLMGRASEGTVKDAMRRNPEAFDDYAVKAGYASFEDLQRRGGKFGIGSDNLPMPVMNEEQAEAEWVQDEVVFKNSYFYADEDVAKDGTKPFGYFHNWPGRDGVYEQIESAMVKYNNLNRNPDALKFYNKWAKAKGQPLGFNIVFAEADHVNFETPSALMSAIEKINQVVNAVAQFTKIITSEKKKKISQFNKLMPNQPFKTSLADYDSPEDLASKVSNFTRNFARLRALGNVQFHGKAKAPNTGYTKGPNEVIYDDEFMSVVIPASAGAALKKGWNDWCISNRSRFDDYFKTGQEDKLYWAHPNYGRSAKLGVFGFWTFKIAVEERNQQLDGFFRLGSRTPGSLTISSIEWTDKVNSAQEADQCNVKKVEMEIAAIDPRALDSFHRSIEEVKAWVMQHKPDEDIEQLPPLESLAQKLVAMVLGEVRGTDGRLRL